MWVLVGFRSGDGELSNHLKDGYEPFAVTADGNFIRTFWLKKEVTDEVCLQQPNPVKRTSRRKAGKPKE